MPARTRKATPRKPAPGAKRPGYSPARKQPESLRLRKVVPSYTVNDLTRSIAFYADGLGFQVTERWEEEGKLLGVMLKAGRVELGLAQDDFARGRDRVKGVGHRLWVSTVQDLDALADAIKGRGIVLDQEPETMPWGDRMFTLTDPDGYRLSFKSEQP